MTKKTLSMSCRVLVWFDPSVIISSIWLSKVSKLNFEINRNLKHWRIIYKYNDLLKKDLLKFNSKEFPTAMAIVIDKWEWLLLKLCSETTVVANITDFSACMLKKILSVINWHFKKTLYFWNTRLKKLMWRFRNSVLLYIQTGLISEVHI